MRDSLLARVAEKRPLLKKREIVTAFGKIQPILNIHERICERLEGVIEQWDGDASSASEIWTEAFDDLLRVYPSYCNHCDLAVETIKAACAHSAKLRMFIEDHERSKEFKRQRTVDIMVTPVQRLPSVKLLLESLKKKTRVQREKDQIGEAIEAIDKVLSDECSTPLVLDVDERVNRVACATEGDCENKPKPGPSKELPLRALLNRSAMDLRNERMQD
ncbi:Protein T2 [Parelaphostrongylus tenuis]|uniref:Protein T2 n=1 Tax=Parelaphostrongylus tenuis TaxID=148309 RepID=A0AAD5M7A8_PARTN|nr:Protein T2 [Parelaphostrongylus tenuis]KAJ1352463.1 Protein T2 [Parelaphostrongylus tenuis]